MSFLRLASFFRSVRTEGLMTTIVSASYRGPIGSGNISSKFELKHSLASVDYTKYIRYI